MYDGLLPTSAEVWTVTYVVPAPTFAYERRHMMPCERRRRRGVFCLFLHLFTTCAKLNRRQLHKPTEHQSQFKLSSLRKDPHPWCLPHFLPYVLYVSWQLQSLCWIYIFFSLISWATWEQNSSITSHDFPCNCLGDAQCNVSLCFNPRHTSRNTEQSQFQGFSVMSVTAVVWFNHFIDVTSSVVRRFELTFR